MVWQSNLCMCSRCWHSAISAWRPNLVRITWRTVLWGSTRSDRTRSSIVPQRKGPPPWRSNERSRCKSWETYIQSSNYGARGQYGKMCYLGNSSNPILAKCIEMSTCRERNNSSERNVWWVRLRSAWSSTISHNGSSNNKFRRRKTVKNRTIEIRRCRETWWYERAGWTDWR